MPLSDVVTGGGADVKAAAVTIPRPARFNGEMDFRVEISNTGLIVPGPRLPLTPYPWLFGPFV